MGTSDCAYYGLAADPRYMHEYGLTQEDLAEFAVLMRKRALDPSRCPIRTSRSRLPT